MTQMLKTTKSIDYLVLKHFTLNPSIKISLEKKRFAYKEKECIFADLRVTISQTHISTLP